MICKWIGQSLLLPIAGGSLEGEREKKTQWQILHAALLCGVQDAAAAAAVVDPQM